METVIWLVPFQLNMANLCSSEKVPKMSFLQKQESMDPASGAE